MGTASRPIDQYEISIAVACKAYAVETTLIDATPGLTNEAAGHGSDHGPVNTSQLRIRYDAKVITISVCRSIKEGNSLYEGSALCWRVSVERANRRIMF